MFSPTSGSQRTLSQIEAAPSFPNLSKHSGNSSQSRCLHPHCITLKQTARQNEPTRNWNNTSDSTVIINRTTGSGSSQPLNTSSMLASTPGSRTPHSILCSDLLPDGTSTQTNGQIRPPVILPNKWLRLAHMQHKLLPTQRSI